MSADRPAVSPQRRRDGGPIVTVRDGRMSEPGVNAAWRDSASISIQGLMGFVLMVCSLGL